MGERTWRLCRTCGIHGRWSTERVGDATVHVIPLRDVMVHLPEEDCPCRPRLEFLPATEDRRDGWIYHHHAIDGRAAHE